MKKTTLILFLLLFIVIEISAQTPYKNYQKYKYFRQRLRNDFMIVDANNSQGSNIPAGSRNRWGGWLDYGENTMIECFLPYMELLSTEYAVNKKYGLNNTQTLNELSYLLLAIERIDLNAEKFFRAETLDKKSPTFWTDIDNYIYAEDLNGFFLRSDIESHYDTFDNDGDLIYEENRIYYADSNRYIFNKNNSQLQHVDYYDGQIVKATSVFNKKLSFLTYKGIHTNNRSVMSQDEVASLFMGLALIAKLVDDERLFTDTEGEQVTIRRWCGKIAHRTMLALHDADADDKWQIYNPVTGKEVYGRIPKDEPGAEPDAKINGQSNGGDTYGMSAGFQLASAYIVGLDIGNSPQAINDFNEIFALTNENSFAFRLDVFGTAFDIVTSHSIWKSSDLIAYNLGIISGWIKHIDYDIPDWIENVLKDYYLSFLFGNTIRYMKKNTNKIDKITFEFYPMFYSILHDVDMENEWVELNNFVTYDEYVDSIEMLLNVIPECGSYVNDTKGAFSDYYWINSRHAGTNKLNGGNFCEVYPYPEPDTDERFYGLKINSNMDYMILYNMYYLLLSDDFDANTSTAWANRDFPFQLNPPSQVYVGSHDTPVRLYGSQFEMNHTIFEDGDVTLVAEDYIELLPGFEVKEGGTFIGEIGVHTPNCDFNFTGTHPCAPDKSYDNSPFEEVGKADLDKIETETSILETYKLYPNPVTNYLRIDFENEFSPSRVQLVDYSGKPIQEFKNPNNYLVVDFSRLPAGLYFLIIEGNNQIYTEKIIKN